MMNAGEFRRGLGGEKKGFVGEKLSNIVCGAERLLLFWGVRFMQS